jgi:hypothetical protein
MLHDSSSDEDPGGDEYRRGGGMVQSTVNLIDIFMIEI